jgi:thioredoxin reductase (NADPH)
MIRTLGPSRISHKLPEAIGGQAGTSSQIRNYLGFPAGVSGADLAERAYTQAWNFGAEYVYGNPATGLRARGSVKRVAAAVGEGSIVIRLIHDYLRGN